MSTINHATIQAFEEKLDQTFENQSALEAYLTDRFYQILATSEDPQASFDQLNKELEGLLTEHQFAYVLEGDHTFWPHESEKLFDALNMGNTGVDVRKELKLPPNPHSEEAGLFATKSFETPQILYFG